MKQQIEEEPTIFAPVIYKSLKEKESFFDVIWRCTEDIYLSGYLDRRKCWSCVKLKFSPQLDQVRKFTFHIAEHESYLSYLCYKTPDHLIKFFWKTITVEYPILKNARFLPLYRASHFWVFLFNQKRKYLYVARANQIAAPIRLPQQGMYLAPIKSLLSCNGVIEPRGCSQRMT